MSAQQMRHVIWLAAAQTTICLLGLLAMSPRAADLYHRLRHR